MASFHSNRTVTTKVIWLKRTEVGWFSNCCLHKRKAENSATAQSMKLDALAPRRITSQFTLKVLESGGNSIPLGKSGERQVIWLSPQNSIWATQWKGGPVSPSLKTNSLWKHTHRHAQGSVSQQTDTITPVFYVHEKWRRLYWFCATES